MSRNRDEDDATPRFNDKSNSNNNKESSKMRASIDAKLEDLMKRLEKLMTENNKLRRKVKAKRTKEGSSSSEEKDSSYEEEDSKKWKKRRNNRDKPSYNSMSFNYDNMPNTTVYTSVPIGKALFFDETCYNKWKHCMKKLFILYFTRGMASCL
jgi:seryl-tRNA synthetase